MQLPLSAEDITAAWLTDALQARAPGAEVLALSRNDTLAGTATKLRLSVELNDAAKSAGVPSSLVVKGRFMRDLQIIETIFRDEVRFYRELAPQLGLAVPQCWFAGHDHEAGQHIVILEDLDLRGVNFCRVANPLTRMQAEGFLDNMARLHAAYWESDALKPGGALADLHHWDAMSETEAGDHARRQLQPDVWTHHMNLPRGIGLPQRFRNRDWMEGALFALNRFGRRGPMTLLHGDHHLGNLYLEPDGSPGVLDWQCPSIGAWSHDLTYFLVSALDIEDRRNWDRDLITYYLKRLQDNGVRNPPTLAEAMDAFAIQIVDGLFYWAVNPVEWQAELNNCAVAPRFAVAALDHDTAGAVAREQARA